jgi:hypothetical protein
MIASERDVPRSSSPLAVALTGCAKGCFRPHTEKVLRGPVKLTVTTSTDVYNAGVHTSHTLEVAAATPYKIGVPCDKPDLDENDAGTLVAWKCPRDEAWSLSRIVGAHHYEERRLGDLGAGKEATFGKVKSLYDAIASITADLNERGTSRPRLEVLEWLTQDLRAERGAEGVAALFAEAARYPAERDQDPWTTALAKASHPERDAPPHEALPAARRPADRSGDVRARRSGLPRSRPGTARWRSRGSSQIQGRSPCPSANPRGSRSWPRPARPRTPESPRARPSRAARTSSI